MQYTSVVQYTTNVQIISLHPVPSVQSDVLHIGTVVTLTSVVEVQIISLHPVPRVQTDVLHIGTVVTLTSGYTN